MLRGINCTVNTTSMPLDENCSESRARTQNEDCAFATRQRRPDNNTKSARASYVEDGTMRTGSDTVARPTNHIGNGREITDGVSLGTSRVTEVGAENRSSDFSTWGTSTLLSAGTSIRLYGRPKSSEEIKRTAQACVVGARCAIMHQVRKVASYDPWPQAQGRDLTMSLPLLPRRQPNNRRPHCSFPNLTDGRIRSQSGRIPRFSDPVAVCKMEQCVVVLQKFWRMYVARKAYQMKAMAMESLVVTEEEKKKPEKMGKEVGKKSTKEEEANGPFHRREGEQVWSKKDRAPAVARGSSCLWYKNVPRRREAAAALCIQMTFRSSRARQILAILRAEQQVRYFQMLVGNMRDDIWIEELGNEIGVEAYYLPPIQRRRSSRRSHRRRRQSSGRSRRRNRFRKAGFVSTLESIHENEEDEDAEHEAVETSGPTNRETSLRLRPYGYHRQPFLPSLPPPPFDSPSLPSPRLDLSASSCCEAPKKRRSRKKFVALPEEHRSGNSTAAPLHIVSQPRTTFEVSNNDVSSTSISPSLRRFAFSKSQIDSFFREGYNDVEDKATNASSMHYQEDSGLSGKATVEDEENAGVGFINRLFFGHSSAVPFWKAV